MAELTARFLPWRRPIGPRGGDLAWALAVGGVGAVVVALVLTYSVQAACSLVLVLLVFAIYRQDRGWGIAALFAFWFLAPWLRRVLDLMTGYVNTDPLSVAPFFATGAIAAFELLRSDFPARIRRILLLAFGGFAFGFPLGLLHPSAGLYALAAYTAGVSAAILGLSEGPLLQQSTLRKVLLLGLVPIAAYAVLQRVLPLPTWDQSWLTATGIDSIGTSSNGKVRVFATLNAPGTLAPLLGLALLCYLTVRQRLSIELLGLALIGVALSLTLVRSAWVALAIAGLAHVIASRGASSRPVFGAAALAVAGSLALSPVSSTARDVVNRFKTIGSSSDTSVNERKATFSQTLPRAVSAPLGHGLGTAGEPTKLTPDTTLRAPDNGYLSLIYQVGPVGFLMVIAAIAFMLKAAWNGARARAPGQDLRLLLFAMFVFLLVSLTSGDGFYGTLGVIFWFIGGQALAFEWSQRVGSQRVGRTAMASR